MHRKGLEAVVGNEVGDVALSFIEGGRDGTGVVVRE